MRNGNAQQEGCIQKATGSMRFGTDAFYLSVNLYLREHERLCGTIVWGNRILTGVVFISYPLLLLLLFATGHFAVRFVTIPAGGFAGLSVVRFLLGQKRPYEKLAITPLVNKTTKGRSFPSRHVFSAFMIAMSYLGAQAVYGQGESLHFICLFWGIVLLVTADVIGDLRVLMGVHFLRDTFAGAVCGMLCGILYFW